MRKLIFSICLLIISIAIVHAQKPADAEGLINNFISTTRTDAIRSGFNLKISEKNAVNSQVISGTFILKGTQFYLEMDEMQVWFDGKTQWVVMKGSNEVSITEPSDEELAGTNPVSILSAYKKVSKVSFSKVKSVKNHVIVMTPQSKNAQFLKVEVQLVKATGNLSSILMQLKDGTTNLLTLHNYQKSVAVNQSTFVFDKSKFKGIIVNDLR